MKVLPEAGVKETSDLPKVLFTRKWNNVQNSHRACHELPHVLDAPNGLGRLFRSMSKVYALGLCLLRSMPKMAHAVNISCPIHEGIASVFKYWYRPTQSRRVKLKLCFARAKEIIKGRCSLSGAIR